MTTTAQHTDFEGFYQAHYRDTVAMIYTFTADLPAAQDIAQEAFTRAWQRWHQVSVYENPVAWIRRVAFNLAHTRWRRLKVATAYLLKQRVEDEPAVSPNHVAVVAALRKLPQRQREAIVLHYIADLPLEAVAHELEAPIGTVKSWLHRGRAAMAHDLVIDIEGSVKAPPAADVVDRARRRVRARAATVAAMLVLLVFGVLFLVRLLALRPDSVPVTPSPTPSTVDSSLRTVDWANATIDFLPRAYCPDGRITVQPTDTVRTSGPRDSWPKIGYLPDRVIVADVTRDGSDDAIIGANCARSADTDPNDVWLAVITRAGDGTLRQLAWIGGVNADLGFTVENGQIHVNGKQFEWDGTGFVAAS